MMNKGKKNHNYSEHVPTTDVTWTYPFLSTEDA